MRVGIGLPTTTPGADGRPVGRLGAPGGRRAVLLARGARPAALRLVRAVRGAVGRGRGDRADPAGHGDRDRPAAPGGDADQDRRARCRRSRAGGSRSGWPSARARTTTTPRGCRIAGAAGGSPTSSLELRDWADAPVMPGAARDAAAGAAGRRRRGPAAFARMARYADGYVHGGGPPRAFASAATKARAAWSDLGRPGEPRAVGPGLLRARRRGRRRGLPARLLRLHRPVRGQDRGREPHLAPARSATSCARTRRRAATSWCCSRPSPTSASSTAWPTCWREGHRPGRRACRAVPRDPAQDATAHEVVVIERNPPDATFGFGVVFSEETLGRLRDADEPTTRRSRTRSRAGRRSTSTSAAR